MSSNQLVDYLITSGVLKTPLIVKAFRSIDRARFINVDLLDQAYGNYPLPIGYGQTISQPWTIAFMLELLQPKRGNIILDVGAGSGYTTALLAECVGPKGKVIGVEIILQLTRIAQQRLDELGIINAEIIAGNASTVVKRQKFDRIFVSAAALEIPKNYLAALRANGRLVIPVHDPSGLQSIYLVRKTNHGLLDQSFPGFAFVPLK